MPLTLAYIHTTHILIPLFSGLSKSQLQGVDFFHILDESLIRNTFAAGALTKKTVFRLAGIVGSAREAGADAVMVTCSSIGAAVPVIRQLFDFPLIRIDEAMAERAVRMGNRIGVAATVRTTLEPTVALLREKAAASSNPICVVECLCEGAFEAVVSGDTETHDRLVSASLERLAGEADVIVLAQASMARVAGGLRPDAKHVPILSSPEFAVQHARSILLSEVHGGSSLSAQNTPG